MCVAAIKARFQSTVAASHHQSHSHKAGLCKSAMMSTSILPRVKAELFLQVTGCPSDCMALVRGAENAKLRNESEVAEASFEVVVMTNLAFAGSNTKVCCRRGPPSTCSGARPRGSGTRWSISLPPWTAPSSSAKRATQRQPDSHPTGRCWSPALSMVS